MQQDQLAIAAALNSDWKKATEINQQILKENPKNIDALNRLGFAFLNLGSTTKAKKNFDKVLKLDPFNPIALKNINKIKEISQKPQINYGGISPKVFLEEPGVTKIVNLINIAEKCILVTLHCGQPVLLIPKKKRIEIRTDNNIYLGALPDDLSFKLKKLIRLGNQYCAFIKQVNEQQLFIILREIKRSKKVKDASFVSRVIPQYHSSIRSELLEELIEDGEASSEGKEEEAEEE